jgi:hypothetical protein
MISVTEIARIARNRNGIARNRSGIGKMSQATIKKKPKIARIARESFDHATGNRQKDGCEIRVQITPIRYQPITAMLFRFRPIPLRFRAIPRDSGDLG